MFKNISKKADISTLFSCLSGFFYTQPTFARELTLFFKNLFQDKQPKLEIRNHCSEISNRKDTDFGSLPPLSNRKSNSEANDSHLKDGLTRKVPSLLLVTPLQNAFGSLALAFSKLGATCRHLGVSYEDPPNQWVQINGNPRGCHHF